MYIVLVNRNCKGIYSTLEISFGKRMRKKGKGGEKKNLVMRENKEPCKRVVQVKDN